MLLNTCCVWLTEPAVHSRIYIFVLHYQSRHVPGDKFPSCNYPVQATLEIRRAFSPTPCQLLRLCALSRFYLASAELHRFQFDVCAIEGMIYIFESNRIYLTSAKGDIAIVDRVGDLQS
jgi:hypothetical protein